MPDSTSPRRAALCVNANARRGKEWFDQARTALEDAGIKLESTKLFKKAEAMDREIKRLMLAETPLIVVGGGDGTMQSAASWMAYSDSVLGVLPLGTGNSFARDLGIKTDLAFACDVIANGEVSEVDLGVINGEPFLNVATIGLSSLIARELDPSTKRIWGPVAYVGAFLRALRIVKPFRARLKAPDIDETFDCLQVVIGNGRFHAGPFPISEDAGITTGDLVVYAVVSKEKRTIWRYMIQMLRGRLEETKEIDVHRLGAGRIETSPIKSVTVDGETNMKTPVEFSVAPKALKVMAPKAIPGEDQSASS